MGKDIELDQEFVPVQEDFTDGVAGVAKVFQVLFNAQIIEAIDFKLLAVFF
jgi:hypothetical protein